jgi:tetratricopeptide (TPR) repeat protein/transcriptional regulator with XRE-family HTH domain
MTSPLPAAELQRITVALARLLDAAEAEQPVQAQPEYNLVHAAASGRYASVSEAAEHPPTPSLLSDLEAALEQLARLRGVLLRGSPALFADLAPLYEDSVEVFLANRAARVAIALRLREARTRLGMTLAQVGDLMGGKTPSYISQIEKAKTLVSEDGARRLDAGLGLKPPGTPDDVGPIRSRLIGARERQSEVESDKLIIDDRRRELRAAGHLEALSLEVPIETIHALAGWVGPVRLSDLRALELLAADPEIREAVQVLGDLPNDVQRKALGLLVSMRDMAAHASHDTVQATRWKARPYRGQDIWRRQRDQLADVSKWDLPTLVLELVELFAPVATRKVPIDRRERLRQVSSVLAERGFDVDALIEGPILRQATALIVERWLVIGKGDRELSTAQDIPQPLVQWLDRHASHGRVKLSRSMWSHWASIPPSQAVELPPPPEEMALRIFRTPAVIDWFYERVQSSDYGQWRRSSLEYEMDALRGATTVPLPWHAALQLWKGDPDLAERELSRRRQRVRAAESDVDLAPRERADSLISMGFVAYENGNTEEALRIFQAATERFPNSSVAWNNYGFVLLTQGQYRQALGALQRAAELGPDDEAITLFNIACCHYMVGEYNLAFEGFRACMRLTPPTRALLNIVDGKQVVRIDVRAAGDYMALVALNAAWSAFQAGNMRAVNEYRSIAATGDLTFRDTPSEGAFSKAATHLAEALNPPTG